MEDNMIFRLAVCIVAALVLMRLMFGKDEYDE